MSYNRLFFSFHRIFVNSLSVVDGVVPIHLHDSLCISEHADIGVQSGPSDNVSNYVIPDYRGDHLTNVLLSFPGAPSRVNSKYVRS